MTDDDEADGWRDRAFFGTLVHPLLGEPWEVYAAGGMPAAEARDMADLLYKWVDRIGAAPALLPPGFVLRPAADGFRPPRAGGGDD